jgi:uncharacterized membrane protein YhdT
VAVWLAVARNNIAADFNVRRSAVRAATVALLLQSAHFVEEAITGFNGRFPRLLGLTPWSSGFFMSFNIFWLAVWTISIMGLHERQRVALFPLWFLGLGCMANGLAHPGLALVSGGYFSGLVTAPFVGIAGVLLLSRLSQVTAGPDASWPPSRPLQPTSGGQAGVE